MKTAISLSLFLALAASQVLAADNVMINGAGATFPYPLYSKWFAEYQKANPKIQINYQSIGSGGGIRQFSEGTLDFGATDAPMTDDQLKKAKQPPVHIPTALGAVVLTYNVPGVTQSLKLNGEVIAGIFLGKVAKWNDPALVKLNPGANLPDQAILVAHRSDGSGTTFVFTDYLSKVSPEWKEKAGTGTAVSWPTGLGGKGNEGVTGLIKQTPGSIGYVELIYAENNKLPVAQVQNKAGAFVVPSAKSVTSAAAGALKAMPEDFRVSIANAEGKESYPISSFTYILVSQQMPAGSKSTEMLNFLSWAISDGQKFNEKLGYAPLPKQLVTKIAAKLKSVKVSS